MNEGKPVKGKWGYYDQSSYNLWMKHSKIWRYPDAYDSSKQFHLTLPKDRGQSITIHCILLNDGRVLYDIGGRSTIDSILDFLNRKLRNVNNYLIVHDRLAANRNARVQDAFKARGATTLLTPASSSPLSSVETIFAITKERYRKWLLGKWGRVTRDESIAELRNIYDGISKHEGRAVCLCATPIYQQVLEGHPC